MTEHQEPNDTFSAIAGAINHIDSNDDYSVGVANGYMILYKEYGPDTRVPHMELRYNEDQERWEAHRL